ncbi:hypothetical protein FSP39_011385 [Pinctada imbricata]|uniref:Uncharacterized protein n=1 Tax=Pinctada imbricata TaxID=66713 RepID=A0AA88Y273_PINIB|nr:hypothetical protein FSP39_011385 [Pinctada imbricata]
MAKHVFSHLTPDHSYLIDERAISQPLKCPCGIKGCDKVLNFGNTSIGSSQSWHGSVDIVINDKVPVIYITDPIDECYGNGYDIDSNESDSEWGYLEINPNEPVGESIEMENTSTSLDIMYRKKIQDQIISQAITNGFVQLNTNPSLKGMFIPSLGCSQDHIFAFLYDPENDVLLKTPDFEISQNNTELNKMGLIHAWMFLNFTALFKSDVAPKLKISRFHNVVGDSLHDYRKAGKRFQFFQQNENDGYRRAYEIMYRNGKIVGD